MLDLKVIFSGSSALRLDNSKGDLSRRAILYYMKGLSFREFIKLKTDIVLPSYRLQDILEDHENIAYEINSKIKPFEFWEEYIKYGYYPFYFENNSS